MRLIDADALKEHLDYVCVGGGKWGDAEKAFINAFKDFVDGEITIQLELPSAQQWIPCSERLPEEDGRYLVTICDRGIKEFPLIRMYSYAKNLKAVDKYDFPKKINGWFGYDGEFGYYEVPDVVAWMPMPKPYEGRTECSQ